MIIALTTTIITTFNVLTGVTKAPCPIKCRCGICAISWSSLEPTASFRAPSVWSPLWPVTVHWIRFCERKRLKPKYHSSLVVVVWWWWGAGGGGGGWVRREKIWDLRFAFPSLSSLPKQLRRYTHAFYSLRLTRVKFVYSWFNKVCSGKLLVGGSLNQIIALFHIPNAQLPMINLLPKQPFLI